MRRQWMLALAFLAAAVPTLAAGAEPLTSPPTLPVNPPAATTATCVNGGNSYRVGEYACIRACHGERRLARCDAVTSQPSWTFVSDVCPSALLAPTPGEATAIPVSVEMTPLPLPIEHLMSEMTPESWMRLMDAGKDAIRTN